MKIKKKYRILLAVLACLVLVVSIGVIYVHGEWWFPLIERSRPRAKIDLTEIALSGNTDVWTLEELAACDRVTFSISLMLINSEYPIPENFSPDLIEYNGARMYPLMRDPYIALRDDVQAKTGIRIYVSSDYRTSEEQAEINASKEDGIAAPVGCSEHEVGLALDVYAPHFVGMRFLRSRAGREVNRTCADYGYIIRYPDGARSITGISYEPWHLRYVGQPHARIITDSKLTLEEYIDHLTPNVWYESGEYLIARLSPDALILPTDFAHCDLSPDNTGYYIVTITL